MARPGVARAGETGKGNQLFGPRDLEVPVHAAVV